MHNINVARYDRGSVRGDAKITDEGYIRANAIVTRTGVFNYKNTDGSVRRELRHPDDVWNEDSISSMEMIPVTNGHPQERLVTAENSKRLAIGYTGETIKKDGNFILANFVVTDIQGVEEVTKNNRKELSLGYTVDLIEEKGVFDGEEYDARQKNIRYNHLAIVDKARAGSEARIALDAEDAFEIINEGKKMTKKRIKIDAEEMMVEESTAAHWEKLIKDRSNLEDELARVKSELEKVNEELDGVEGERDSWREKASMMKEQEVMSYDSADFKRAVSKRMSLIKVAESTLPSLEHSKLDSMSDIEIKKAVIGVQRKSIKLDGKSEIYVEAMFDTILDDREQTQVKLDNVTFGEVQIKSDSLSARDKMMEKQKNAHFKKEVK